MRYADWKAVYIDKTKTLRNWEINQAISSDGLVKININGLGEANIPTAKLTRYALNPEKDINKARAFESALGYKLGNADKLLENIKRNINKFPIVEKPDVGYGKRFQIILELVGKNGNTAKVLTGGS